VCVFPAAADAILPLLYIYFSMIFFLWLRPFLSFSVDVVVSFQRRRLLAGGMQSVPLVLFVCIGIFCLLH
jgi:hypothetical protein